MFDSAEAVRYLALVHGDAPGRIHICGTGAWAGRTFPAGAYDEAVDYARSLDAEGREGVYARVTTLVKELEPGSRGGVADTLALPALWADVDIAGPGHVEQNLPPDEVAASEIIATSGLPIPTFWVHSGGGVYPIWLLFPPYVVEATDLADVSALSMMWQQIIGASAARLGFHYGTGVGDLARVLRLPGSVNRKAGLARRCRMMGDSGTHYSLADLLKYAEILRPTAPVVPEPVAPAPARLAAVRDAGPADRDGPSPGDDYANRTDWADILTPHGWTYAYASGDTRYWIRPGKDDGVSASTNATGTDRLKVFSTSTPFDTTGTHSKLDALAVLEFGGDHRAAARHLMDRGFGRPTVAPWARQAEIVAGIMGRPLDTVPLPPAAAETEEGRHHAAVLAEAARQRIQREARRLLDDEEHAAGWREPVGNPTMVEDLLTPDEPVMFRVQRLLPSDGNALLAAQFKAGKTTLINYFARSLADGTPFLDRFDVAPLTGRVALWNYELNAAQYIHSLRRLHIVNPQRISVLNLRGHSMPVSSARVREWIIRWLGEHQTEVWVVDPFARAFVGSGDENSNSDVGTFLDWIDVIKARAGVRELVLPVHTGRAEQTAGMERARGATRLDDWADSRWLLTMDDAGRRFLRASGRDVDVDEEALNLDAGAARLVLGGWDRRGMASQDLAREVAEYVAGNPGLCVAEVVAGMGKRKARIVTALQSAIAMRLVVTVDAGHGKRLHYPIGAVPTVLGEAS